MRFASRSVASHGVPVPGPSIHSEFVACAFTRVPRESVPRHHHLPLRAACPEVEDVASSSSEAPVGVDGKQSCLRHLEKSWAGSPISRSPWALLSVDDRPQQKKNNDKTPSFFANVGDAIRSLREDIPRLFEKDLNYEIYTENILFKDPKISFQGIKNYKTMFWSLRFHGGIFFKKLFVEVKRIWQPEDMVIKMRFTVHGVPRLFGENECLFDGISTYKLDENGRIYEHNVDTVLLRDTPMFSASPMLAGIDRALGGSPTPQQVPYPGAWGYGLERQLPMVQQLPSSFQEPSAASLYCGCSTSGAEEPPLHNSSPSAFWQPLLWYLITSRVLARASRKETSKGVPEANSLGEGASQEEAFYWVELEGSGA